MTPLLDSLRTDPHRPSGTRRHGGGCSRRAPERDAANTRPTRRRVLFGVAAAGTAALAGCLSESDTEHADADPIDLTGGQECESCGMVIDDHYGPAGQLFAADDGSDGQDEPAAFDSVDELVVAHGERTARGESVRAVFVTDYSSVDYDLVSHDESTHISRHAEKAAFDDATSLSFVVGSDVDGAMGPDSHPFSDPADAETFAADNGGDVLEWDDLVNDGT